MLMDINNMFNFGKPINDKKWVELGVKAFGEELLYSNLVNNVFGDRRRKIDRKEQFEEGVLYSKAFR